MASPSPLHVRVSHSTPAPRLRRKLESYFQSRQSGGGECTVRHDDSGGPDAFLVTFRDRADKESVLKKENHHLIIGDDTVEICLEPTENPTQESTSPQSFSLTPLGEELRPDEKNPNEEYSPDALVSSDQKVFLDVTADLNCDLFSKEQRNHIPILWPNVRRMEGSKGIEKVCGDFRDIDEIHHYLSELLLEDELKHGSSASLEERPALGAPNWSSNATFQGMRPLHQPPEQFSNVTALEQKIRNEEKSLHFEVPCLFFEYFKYVFPHKIDSIERKFGIKIKTQENFPHSVFLEFIANESGDIDSALASFAGEFQKVTETLGQERVPFPDRKKLHKIKQELALQFNRVLIKENEGGLTLIGPQDDITAAKHFLASPACDSLTKVSLKILPPEYMVNGIEVDTSQYQLLTAELHKEISEIEEKFNTQSRVLVKGQKTVIVFEPKDKELDLSVHAYVNFIDAYQDIASQVTQETLSLKSSGQKKKYFQDKKFSDDFRKNHPHVHFVPSEETLGLLNLLAKTEQFVLQREGTSSLTEEKQSGDHETAMDIDSNSSTASATLQHSASAGDIGVDDDKNLCSICMETIRDKKVLSKCKHEFCTPCIDKAMSYKPSCPLCQTNYGVQTGNQPEGTMEVHLMSSSLPGHKHFGTIEITYKMKGGIQTEKHPNPGKRYFGIERKAYLPNNEEGKKVLELLQRAFQQRLIFTVGNSRTTGATDVITWNDIHHKTSISGGPENYGYPDPDYLKRVKRELKDKGIE